MYPFQYNNKRRQLINPKDVAGNNKKAEINIIKNHKCFNQVTQPRKKLIY